MIFELLCGVVKSLPDYHQPRFFDNQQPSDSLSISKPRYLFERLVLQIYPETKKVVCSSYNMEGILNRNSENLPVEKLPATVIELKSQSLNTPLHLLTSKFHFDLEIPLFKNFSIRDQVETQISRIYHQIEELIVIGKESTFHSRSVDTLPSIKQDQHEIEFYCINPSMPQSQSEQLPQGSFLGTMLVGGILCGVAYVHPKETIANAILALKSDLVGSLATRFSLLCDSIEREKQGHQQDLFRLDPKMQHWDFPSRVLLNFPSNSLNHLHFCDYLFPDETFKDCKERCFELLNLDLKDESSLLRLEPLRSKPREIKKDQLEKNQTQQQKEKSASAPTLSDKRVLLFVFSTFIVLLLALLMGYLISQ